MRSTLLQVLILALKIRPRKLFEVSKSKPEAWYRDEHCFAAQYAAGVMLVLTSSER